MQLSSFLKVGRKLGRNGFSKLTESWKRIMNDSVSPEYERWRHGFVLKRLYLITWVAVVVMAIGQIVNWIIPLTSLDLSSAEYDFYQQNLKLVNTIVVIGWLEILFTFVLLKVSYARKYPILILLWLTWTLLVSHQVLHTVFWRLITVDGYGWILVFSAGPILMPVRWQWHCLCQIFVLGYFTISSLVFGLQDPFVSGVEYFNAVYITIVVCLIVNYAVFIYERFLQQEFELKRQLRLFLHTVSHDLRNPVLGTMFLLKSLRNPAAKETVVENEILDQMIDSSDRQLQLIDSLLEAHNTETKGIVLRPRPVSLDNLVQSVIVDMQPFFDRDKATVTQKTSATLPLVNIDPLQVRRVYENLITNALEYNQPGLHLTLEVKDDRSLNRDRQQTVAHRWIYCIVSDNGIGISPKQSSQIFDLYTRAVSNKQSLNVGLGLYICRQIINAHGGEIGVDSTPTGASFWFTLPISIDTDRLSKSKPVR